ncbi:hypothetical protein [Nocardia gipuzkoensis]
METIDKLDYRRIREYAIAEFPQMPSPPRYEPYFEGCSTCGAQVGIPGDHDISISGHV